MIEKGLILGESPLSLPSVCFNCACDVAGDGETRHRTRYRPEQAPPNAPEREFTITYSICTKCWTRSEKWRMRRNFAIYFFLALFVLGGCVGVLAMAYLSGGSAMADKLLFMLTAFLSSMMLVFAAAASIGICHGRVLGGPSIRKFDGNKIFVAGANQSFLRRFR
ncbi:hypothetical protein LOC68_17820 [Blastopirellula sp. JC732]|uniref:Uncharacterized protein n=1 Tax=Blastopirellula sediminis TaxID=2894196 RepID=A0A9X1MPC0_9BACT|nr:hypothetical protein [Blastopirellula sediminis]MCC9606446.1 hypothetical protein [Blastopirellula sediminis]MCC9630256.1 hypothetical protein [Blastopirellula sediminis]